MVIKLRLVIGLLTVTLMSCVSPDHGISTTTGSSAPQPSTVANQSAEPQATNGTSAWKCKCEQQSADLAGEKKVIPIIDYRERFIPVVAQHGMVVGPEQLAAEVGADMLRQGGNAVDAAVATGFALAVTYPRAGNLAGGGFMLIHLAKDNRQTLIDYRETAPTGASRDMFLDSAGNLDHNKEYFSLQSAGVPGTVAGLLYALDKYGTLSRKQVLAPAIALARDGMTVSFALYFELGAAAEQLHKDPEATRLFFKPDGAPYQMGDKLKQTDLAWTLQQISDHGDESFYRGDVAKRITAAMQAGGGLITAEDLAQYRAIEREPVSGTYRGFEVVSSPPPSSGGVHILEMLNILEGYDLQAMGQNSAAYVHHLTESMKLAYADRSLYLGDPDFVKVPVDKLIDKNYAAQQRTRIDSAHATPSADIAPGKLTGAESTETTHYSVADQFGNVVSNTYTLNFSFGSNIAVPGTGMLLNNEMADFATSPGNANAFGLVQGESNKIEPGKRPLSSMTPTIVLKGGKPWLATGSPGGSVIITTVLQMVLNTTDFGMNVATAAAEPRIHHQWMPDTLQMETGFSADTIKLLKDMGQQVNVTDRTTGQTTSIMLENGWMYGAADTRRAGGWAAGY